MKKCFLTTLTVIGCLFASMALNAQSWSVYDASMLPDASSPAFTLANTGGPSVANNGSYLVDDPSNANNKFLEFRVDSALSKICWSNSWGIKPDQGATILFKAKALNVEEYPNVLEFEMRTGAYRERFIIGSDGNIRLNQSAVTASVPSVGSWNIYRITVKNDTFSVYVNEAPVPVLIGKTPTTNTNNDFRFGDGSTTDGANFGAMIDWVLWDTTGAYIPGKGASLPENTSIVCGSNKGDIFFVTKPDALNFQTNVQGDVATIDFLKIQGYKVKTGYPTDLDWSYDNLDNAKMVIIGRSISSGDFGKKDSLWALVKSPVIVLSQYAAQSGRLKMFNSTAVLTDTTFEGDLKAKVHAPGDDVFYGLEMSEGDTIPYSTGSYTTIRFSADSFADQNNGKILLTANLTNSTGTYSNLVLMARWEAGVETYPGSAVIPSSNWTYMGIGDDQKRIGGPSGTKITNLFCFTEESKQLLLNEINRLQKNNQKLMYLTSSKTNDSLSIDALKQAGYQVDVDYVTDEGFSYTALNTYNAVIVGRGISSAHFVDTLWKDVKAPVMVMSQYAAQNKRLKLFNSSAVLVDTTHEGTLKAKVLEKDESVFSNISLSDGDSIEFLTGSYTLIRFGLDSITPGANVLVKASITVPATATTYNDVVVMARFAPDVETYTGSNFKPASTWTYFGFGDDQKRIGGPAGEKLINFFQFTPASKQLWLNEINYLVKTVEVADTTPIYIPSNIATLDSIFINGSKISDFSPSTIFYSVTLPAGTTAIPAVVAYATNDSAKITIANPVSLPGDAIITVNAEDGINKKTYKVRYLIATTITSITTLEVLVYPQPAVDKLNLKVNGSLTNSKVILYNALGQPVISKLMNGNTMVMDVQNLQSGMYFMEISNTSFRKTSTVFIK